MSSIKLKRPVSPQRDLATQVNLPPKPPKSMELERTRSIDEMLTKVLSILSEQIEKYRLKSSSAMFNDDEVRTLDALISSLTKVSREQRERDKANDFGDLSDEDLLALVLDEVAKRGLKVPDAT